MEEVRELSKQGNLIPLYQEINADLETPVSAYLKIAEGSYAFLLESVEAESSLPDTASSGLSRTRLSRRGRANRTGRWIP